MNGLWLASYVSLWLFVLLEGVLLFVLFHELGVRALRTAEGISRDGIAIGAMAPVLEAFDPDGRELAIPKIGLETLLVFGSRTCPPCKQLAPDLNTFARRHRNSFEVYFVIDDTYEGAKRARAELKLEVPVAVHQDGMARYGARVTPFAFVISPARKVISKGLVNTIQGLDLLAKQGLHASESSAEAAVNWHSTEFSKAGGGR